MASLGYLTVSDESAAVSEWLMGALGICGAVFIGASWYTSNWKCPRCGRHYAKPSASNFPFFRALTGCRHCGLPYGAPSTDADA